MGNVVSWVVEEVISESGNIRTQTFTNYDEALEMYNHLKLLNEKNFVSIQKAEKKLLVE